VTGPATVTAPVATDDSAGPPYGRNAARYDVVGSVITFGRDRRFGSAIAGRGELYERLTASTAPSGAAAQLRQAVLAAGLEPLEGRRWAFGLVAGIAARLAPV